jgi:cell division septum initiation protein DivIVA
MKLLQLEQENQRLRQELEELKRQVKDRGREPGR